MGKRCAILTAFDPYSFKGGIETYTHQVVNLLQSREIAVDIYHTGSAHCTRENAAPPLSLHSRFLDDLYRVGRSFYQVDYRYDFVIAHAFFGFGYCPPRIPAFNIFHSTHVQYAEENRVLFSPEWYLEVKYLFGFGAERVSTIGRTIIAVSDEVAAEAAQHYQAPAVSTVVTGVDRTVFFPRAQREALRQKFNIPADAFVGIFLARWDLDKGIDVLTEIMDCASGVFWVLVLGTGSECPLRGKVNTAILENVDQTTVAEILSLADFLLHISRYEGFGLAPVEALACGLPIITTPVGVARSVCQHQPFSPLLLPPYTNGKDAVVVAAIDKIKRVRQDEALSRAIHTEGPLVVASKFDHRRWETDLLAALGIAEEHAPIRATAIIQPSSGNS